MANKILAFECNKCPDEGCRIEMQWHEIHQTRGCIKPPVFCVLLKKRADWKEVMTGEDIPDTPAGQTTTGAMPVDRCGVMRDTGVKYTDTTIKNL